ncbi:hypothetical protein NEIG_01264 [Nematocida sp. ERTm5]|nr:hypothetical protein NEIRO02_1069 [Nematocida sp. AWRm79]KAI5183410.1 hypothetical protein NEIRO03_1006 [Nematocida sp. AWRm78]OAG30244.1 hypothetical protein NEIG_01264 [Nematocida sp. ERTm5]
MDESNDPREIDENGNYINNDTLTFDPEPPRRSIFSLGSIVLLGALFSLLFVLIFFYFRINNMRTMAIYKENWY